MSYFVGIYRSLYQSTLCHERAVVFQVLYCSTFSGFFWKFDLFFYDRFFTITVHILAVFTPPGTLNILGKMPLHRSVHHAVQVGEAPSPDVQSVASHRKGKRMVLIWVFVVAIFVVVPGVMLLGGGIATIPVTLHEQRPSTTTTTTTDTTPTDAPELPRIFPTIRHPNGKITFVLCTWSGDKEGTPRVAMLLSSVQRFLEAGALFEFLFVVPGADAGLYREKIANGFGLHDHQRPTFAMRVVTDQEVLSLSSEQATKLTPRSELHENGGRGTNYRRQMLIKLGISRFVHTSFYITLDSDVFLKVPTGYADLVETDEKGERAIVQGHERDRHRTSWWASAGGIMQKKECGAGLGQEAFQIGVTPAIMSAVLARGLISELETREGKAFDVYMFEALHSPHTSDWTEYTLYWAYGCATDTLHAHHVLRKGKRLYDTSAFGWKSFDAYNVDKVFGDNRYAECEILILMTSVQWITSSDILPSFRCSKAKSPLQFLQLPLQSTSVFFKLLATLSAVRVTVAVASASLGARRTSSFVNEEGGPVHDSRRLR